MPDMQTVIGSAIPIRLLMNTGTVNCELLYLLDLACIWRSTQPCVSFLRDIESFEYSVDSVAYIYIYILRSPL